MRTDTEHVLKCYTALPMLEIGKKLRYKVWLCLSSSLLPTMSRHNLFLQNSKGTQTWETASKTMTRKCDVCGASLLLRILYDMFIVSCVRNGTCKLWCVDTSGSTFAFTSYRRLPENPQYKKTSFFLLSLFVFCHTRTLPSFSETKWHTVHGSLYRRLLLKDYVWTLSSLWNYFWSVQYSPIFEQFTRLCRMYGDVQQSSKTNTFSLHFESKLDSRHAVRE